MIGRPRYAAPWAGLMILALGFLPSCDVLNPEMIATLGGNPAVESVESTGHILLALNNLTVETAILDATVLVDMPGSNEQETADWLVQLPSKGYATALFSCHASSVTVNTVTVIFTPPTPPPDEDGTPAEVPEQVILEVPVATGQFAKPALNCGSIIFVSLAGSQTTGFVASAQLLN